MKLSIKGLTFGYRVEDLIFKSFSYTFEGPLLHVILGPNGVGKSTLLKLIVGILKPMEGEIMFNDMPPARGDIAYVPQDNELLPWLTVISNVELPLKILGVNGEERRLRALKALEAMGVAGYANKYPRQLSGGERKRVAIARAIASNSKVILLDEPTANLDPVARRLLWSYLRDLARSKLVIVITHDVGEALVEDGMVHVMSGRPARILRSFRGGESAWSEMRGVLEAYYGISRS